MSEIEIHMMTVQSHYTIIKTFVALLFELANMRVEVFSSSQTLVKVIQLRFPKIRLAWVEMAHQ